MNNNKRTDIYSYSYESFEPFMPLSKGEKADEENNEFKYNITSEMINRAELSKNDFDIEPIIRFFFQMAIFLIIASTLFAPDHRNKIDHISNQKEAVKIDNIKNMNYFKNECNPKKEVKDSSCGDIVFKIKINKDNHLS